MTEKVIRLTISGRRVVECLPAFMIGGRIERIPHFESR